MKGLSECQMACEESQGRKKKKKKKLLTRFVDVFSSTLECNLI